MSLATCPVCRCVVDGQEEHAKAWHEPIARALAYDVAADPVQDGGGRGWGGPPVSVPPPAPTTVEASAAAVIRERTRALSRAVADALPLLEDYLTATATSPPTTSQAVAQVRVLTQVARGLLLTVRDLVRLTVRALED